MGAREKLNIAVFLGILILAAGIGLLFESSWLFFAVLVIGTFVAWSNGSIRAREHKRFRR
jgi:Flp pilus assembly protein TadB